MKFTPNHKIALFVALVGAGVTLFAYAAVQQDYRQSANDPQIQMSQDAWSALSQGTPVNTVVGDTHVDLSSSLAPFTMVFDSKHKLLASNAINSGGIVPTPPSGTFDFTQQHGTDRFTWQTANGERYAAVMMSADSSHPGYVLAARNLHEVEQREDTLRLMFVATLLGIVVVSVGFVLIK